MKKDDPSTINPNKAYSARYDAYYDKNTGEWLEKQCSDSDNCTYCKNRPEKAF